MNESACSAEAELLARLGLDATTPQPVCDFCCQPPELAPPKWAYPVTTLTVELGLPRPVEFDLGVLGGSWAACDTCTEHIDAGDYHRLAQHMGYSAGVIPASLDAFRNARIGPAQRL